MKKLFESIPTYISKESIGLKIEEEISSNDYIFIETLEKYLKEQKSLGANYIKIDGFNIDGGIDDISLQPFKIIS